MSSALQNIFGRSANDDALDELAKKLDFEFAFSISPLLEAARKCKATETQVLSAQIVYDIPDRQAYIDDLPLKNVSFSYNPKAHMIEFKIGKDKDPAHIAGIRGFKISAKGHDRFSLQVQTNRWVNEIISGNAEQIAGAFTEALFSRILEKVPEDRQEEVRHFVRSYQDRHTMDLTHKCM